MVAPKEELVGSLCWLALVALVSVSQVGADSVVVKPASSSTGANGNSGRPKANTDEAEHTFRVPDPFKLNSGRRPAPNEFHYVHSKQTIYHQLKAARKLEVEEFFSLGQGLTFSVHRERANRHSWAVIGDSKRARSYVVRNIDSSDQDELECELDHAHNHRQLFPWQFVYDLNNLSGEADDASAKQKARRKTRRSSRAFVYGVGAIWLNAVHSDVRSSLVGKESPYATADTWTLEGKNGLRAKLLFEKVAANESDARAIASHLDEARLVRVQIERGALAELPVAAQVPYAERAYSELIEVQELQLGLTFDREHPERTPLLARLLAQLSVCRSETRNHRVFPSLVRALSTSLDRGYKLDYIAHKLPLLREPLRTSSQLTARVAPPASGQYDETHHRYLFPVTLTTEAFSLKNESQTLVYTPLPIDGDGAGARRTDAFIARFTERAAGNQRSSRHSTAHYHLIAESECYPGEREPLPGWPLFMRTLTFDHTKPGKDASYTGHLVGLGALLMNVADMHYKSFALYDQRIQLADNPLNLSSVREALVDEWQLEDQRMGWTLHFYFERAPAGPNQSALKASYSLDASEQARQELARLVRVDVRDARQSLEADDADDKNQHEEGENRDDDADLLMQFTILEFQLDDLQRHFDFLLKPPPSCTSPTKPVNEDADSDSDDESDDNDHDKYFWDNDFEDYESDSENERDHEHDEDESSDTDESPGRKHEQELEQEEADQFEFEPGLVRQDTPLPDLLEFLANRPAYEIRSRLELVDQAHGDLRRHIRLHERVDLERETAQLDVYDSDAAYAREHPDESYYIFYQSELVFRLAGGRCQHSDDVTPTKWLRLLSTPFEYYTVPNYRGKRHERELLRNEALVESSSIPLYGVGALWRRASELQFVEFLGRRKKLLERQGAHFRQLVWAQEEHDMELRFNFLQNLSRIEEPDEEQGPRPHQIDAYLSLDSVDFEHGPVDADLEHDDTAAGDTFGHIHIQIESFDIADSLPRNAPEVPDLCRDQFFEANRMRESTETDIRPPSFLELAGGRSPAYRLHYIVTHRLGAASPLDPGHRSTNTFVTELFDRKLNRGKLVVHSGTNDPKSDLEVYIDGVQKRMYAYTAGAQKCAPIATLMWVFKSVLDLPLENNNFEPGKLYGLAGLWTALAQHDATKRVYFHHDRSGRRTELHAYYMRMAVGGSEAEQRDLQMTFRMRRTHLQIANQTASTLVDGKKVRAQDELQLESIQVTPVQDKGALTDIKNKFKSRVYLDEVTPLESFNYELPAACQHLVPDDGPEAPPGGEPVDSPVSTDSPTARPAPVPGYSFPRVSELLARLNLFHMKSEVSIRGKSLTKVYMLDEWVHNNHLRMRARALGRSRRTDFDFLIYGDSNEQLDLSEAFVCRRGSLPANALELDSLNESNLLAVWTDNTTLVNHLANAYYGPLTLWRMAEKPGARVALANSIEIAPLPVDTNKQMAVAQRELEQELARETWQVSAPPEYPHQWSYKMQFLKNSQVLENGLLHEWHVLESIQIADMGPMSQVTHERRDSVDQFQVSIDVINYKYDAQPDDLLDKFRLPEGWGCRRDSAYVESVDLFDDFRLEPAANWLLTYEAALELFDGGVAAAADDHDDDDDDDPELGPLKLGLEREVLPTTSGVFMKTGTDYRKLSNSLDITVHHSQVRARNGTSQARRIVLDRDKLVQYEINKATGFCTMSLLAAPGWLLEFERPHVSVGPLLINLLAGELHESLLGQLFLHKILEGGATGARSLSAPLNKYSMDGGTSIHSSYEHDIESLRLAEGLVGPARVVRRFVHSRNQPEAPGSTRSEVVDGRRRFVRMHDHVSARVFLFNASRDKLRAVLDLVLRRGREPRLSELLAAANVRQCYNDAADAKWDRRVANFGLELPIEDQFTRLLVHYYAPSIRDLLYEQLMSVAGLLPLQLDGQARIELEPHDNLVRVHFDVLDAPTSYIYFREHIQSSPSDEALALSETRLAPTLLDCSRWCDRLQCVAMSYCDDRTCRVLTARSLFGSRAKSGASLDSSQLQQLAECKPDGACSYYYLDRPWARQTIRHFRDFMDQTVNLARRPHKLAELALAIGPFVVIEPARFLDDTANKFRWQHEDADEDEVDLDEQRLRDVVGEASEATLDFATLRRGQSIDVGALARLNEQHASDMHKFLSIGVTVVTPGECLEACARYDCLLVSHCKRPECLLIQPAEKGQVELGALKRAFVPGAPECSIQMRSHLNSYELFADTFAPAAYERRLDNHSALECAAQCHTLAGQCLSFDLCTFDDDNNEGGSAAAAAAANANSADERSVCLLQQTHLAQDAFDRSILLRAWDRPNGTSNQLDGRPVRCRHYSKSALADFVELANRKLAKEPETSIRGVSADRCALDCLQDDLCAGFEYCRNERRKPVQLDCSLLRANEFEKPAPQSGPTLEQGGDNVDQREAELEATIASRFLESKSCSIYVASQLATTQRLAQTSALLRGADEGEDAGGLRAHSLVQMYLYMLLVVAAGVAVQVAIIRFLGRPFYFGR